MANHQYVKIEASEKAPQKRGIPILFAGSGLLRTLDRLGFTVPAALQAAADEGRPLSRAGDFKIDVHDLDAALKLIDISLEKKMQLKSALIHQGLL